MPGSGLSLAETRIIDPILTSMAQGYTGSDIASMADGNIGRDNATTLVAAAVVYVCPQYESLAIQ